MTVESLQAPTRPEVARAWLRRNLVLLALLALSLGFYIFTAAPYQGFQPTKEVGKSYYMLQAEAYQHGQVSLLIQPRPELLALPNPYDPAANAPYALHDLALHDGRYYLYWGPTPAVALYLPASLVGIDVSDTFAAVLFAFGGLLFAVLLLRELAARLVPRAPPWMLHVATVAIALGNVAPFVLRRPAIYEVAIACGYCFLFAGLWLFAVGALRERLDLRAIALGSLCLGASLGARPVLIFPAAVGCLLVLAGAWSRGRLRRARSALAVGAAVLGPVIVCGLLLLAYNKARFDSFTDFGVTDVLAAVDQHSRKLYSPSYIAPGMWAYFLAPFGTMASFPFLTSVLPDYPGTLPHLYDGIEKTTGILVSTPIVLLAFAAPLILWAWGRASRRVAGIVAACCTAGVLTALSLSFTLFGSTQRYEMDYASLLLVGALLGWFALSEGWRSRPGLRRGFLAVTCALIAFGAVIGVALSFTGYFDTSQV